MAATKIVASYPSDPLTIINRLNESLLTHKPLGIYAVAHNRTNENGFIGVPDRHVENIGGQYLPIEFEMHIVEHNNHVAGVVMFDTSPAVGEYFMPDEMLISLTKTDLMRIQACIKTWIGLFNLHTLTHFEEWKHRLENGEFNAFLGDMAFDLKTGFTIKEPDAELFGGESALPNLDKAKLYVDGGFYSLMPFEHNTLMTIKTIRNKKDEIEFFMDLKVHSDSIEGDIVTRLPFDLASYLSQILKTH